MRPSADVGLESGFPLTSWILGPRYASRIISLLIGPIPLPKESFKPPFSEFVIGSKVDARYFLHSLIHSKFSSRRSLLPNQIFLDNRFKVPNLYALWGVLVLIHQLLYVR